MIQANYDLGTKLITLLADAGPPVHPAVDCHRAWQSVTRDIGSVAEDTDNVATRSWYAGVVAGAFGVDLSREV